MSTHNCWLRGILQMAYFLEMVELVWSLISDLVVALDRYVGYVPVSSSTLMTDAEVRVCW